MKSCRLSVFDFPLLHATGLNAYVISPALDMGRALNEAQAAASEISGVVMVPVNPALSLPLVSGRTQHGTYLF